MNRLAWIFILLMAASSCGGDSLEAGGDAGRSASEATVVTSADGLATLTLHERSLPDDVAVDDIRLQAVIVPDPEPGFPFMVVQLLPHGLALSESAELSMVLPDDLEGSLLIVHQSRDSFEFVVGELEASGDSVLFTTEIQHFSSLISFQGIGTSSLTLTPEVVAPHQVQDAAFSGAVPGHRMKIVLGGYDCWGCKPGNFQAYEFAVEPLRVVKSSVSWVHVMKYTTNPTGPWEPLIVETSPTATEFGWDMAAASTCVEPNIQTVFASFVAEFSFTLLTKTEVSAREFIRFMDGSTAESDDVRTRRPLSWERPDRSRWILDDMQAGDKVVANATLSTTAKAICSDVSSVTSSTLSTLPPVDDDEVVDVQIGQDPRSHITGIAPTSTSNNTLGLVASFAQPWDTLPPSELRSFFIWLSVVGQDCSAEGGWQLHEGVVSNLGPLPMSIVDDGTVFFDTGCPLEPRGPVLVNTRAGSWANDADQAVFRQDVEFPFVADTPLVSMDGRCFVFNLTDLAPLQGCEQP